jgi:hypothetical protein
LTGAVVKGLSVVALAASVVAACSRSPDTHVVLGQRYEVAGDCLQPTSSIEILEGSDPGLGCDPTCVVTPGGVVYASTECGGQFSSFDDTSGADPACAGALAALKNMVVCGGGDDGGGDATDSVPEGSPGAADAPGGDSPEEQEAQEAGLDGG